MTRQPNWKAMVVWLLLAAPAAAQQAPADPPFVPDSSFDPAGALSVLSESTNGGERGGSAFLGLATALSVDQATGSAVMSVPLQIPDGRGAATPALSVSYSSNGGNGLFGVGWTFPIGQLRRCTREGVPFEYENNPADPFTYAIPGDAIPGEGDFILELGGTQLRLDAYIGDAGGGNHRYGSTAEEAFHRVWFNPTANTWTVTDKSGVQYIFGSGPAQTRTGGNVATAKGTFGWGLSRVADTNANAIDVTYATHGLQGNLNRYLYPSRIEYGANTVAGYANHLYRVDMLYEDRDDKRVDYLGGFEQRMVKRVQRIEVSFLPTPSTVERIRSYDFDYDAEPLTGVSRLRWVKSNGAPTTQPPDGPTLPSTELLYASPPNGFDPEPTPGPSWTASSWGGTDDLRKTLRIMDAGAMTYETLDVNGDALPERMGLSGITTPATYTWENTGKSLELDGGYGGWTGDHIAAGNQYATMDLNGDALPDHLITTNNNDWLVRLNNGNGWDPPVTWHLSNLQTIILLSGWSYEGSHNTIDVNGDRRPDHIYCYWTDCDIWLNRKTGFAAEAFSLGAAEDYINFKTFLDMNGDGLQDIIETNEGDFVVRYNTGAGWLEEGVPFPFLDDVGHTGICGPDPWYDNGFDNTVARATADMNGDGLPDCVEAGSVPWQVWFNTGEGFDGPVPWQNTEHWPGIDFPGIEHWVHFGQHGGPEMGLLDLNGDGFLDWVKADEVGWGIRPGQRRRVGEIIEVRNGLGATTAVEYTSLGRLRGTQKICQFGPEEGKPCESAQQCGGLSCTDRAITDHEGEYAPFRCTSCKR